MNRSAPRSIDLARGVGRLHAMYEKALLVAGGDLASALPNCQVNLQVWLPR